MRPALTLVVLCLLALLNPRTAAAEVCEAHQTLPLRAVEPPPGVQAVVFIAKDLRKGTCWHTGAGAIHQRHAPWSTFKIPHVLIALETGAVASADEVLRWDPQLRPAQSYWPAAWKRDQSLRSAFEVSAAWPFQDLVAQVGAANYAKWLSRWGYGNAELPPGRDDFWLGGPLAVSPLEQLAFLSCVALGGCGASPASVRALEAMALAGESAGRRLFAKTGSGPVKPRDFSGAFEGWYVGYIRDPQGAATAAFATYVRSDTYSALRTYRETASLQALSALGLWPLP